MGFSATTKILGLRGFIFARDLKVGDIIRTPLGKTKIDSITVLPPQKYITLSENFDVVRWKRVLLKNMLWGTIQIPEMDLMFSLGVYPKENNTKSSTNDVFSFKPFTSPTTVTDRTENIIITSENGILVADSFVCSGMPPTKMFATLPTINKNMLDVFFNDVSKFYMEK